MELRNNLSGSRSSSLLKYQKRKMIKDRKNSGKDILSGCLSMQSINFQGGIGDLLKNKVKNCKSKSRKNIIRKSSLKTGEFCIKPNNSKREFWKNNLSSSRNADSSASYNQITKEDSNSSSQYTEVSNNKESQCRNIVNKNSSLSAYYETSPKNIHTQYRKPGSPNTTFRKHGSKNCKKKDSTLYKDLLLKFCKDINCSTELISQCVSKKQGYKKFLTNGDSCLDNLSKAEFSKSISKIHSKLITRCEDKWKNHSDILQGSLQTLKTENEELNSKLQKTTTEMQDLIQRLNNSNSLKELRDSSVFNYTDDDIQPKNLRDFLPPESCSSGFLSIPKENSFENTFESIEVRTSYNETSQSMSLIKIEEPKAKNVYDYNMKSEICFQKFKNPKIPPKPLCDITSQHPSNSILSNLQNNMQKFTQYHAGRNHPLFCSRSASITHLNSRPTPLSKFPDLYSQISSEDIELSLSSSEYHSNPAKTHIATNKRANSDFCSPTSPIGHDFVRCASQESLQRGTPVPVSQEQKYLYKENLLSQREVLNERLKN
ncbi:unnamed protein product [Moneuplotes crassus]|uniref:Uncharacterized protein n=1 Tax=Euplotes crassus TaxID=5936 RepID=A0AAD1XB25_EUPCR|nr:unnamed protein product [Moneuplotes crassus]